MLQTPIKDFKDREDFRDRELGLRVGDTAYLRYFSCPDLPRRLLPITSHLAGFYGRITTVINSVAEIRGFQIQKIQGTEGDCFIKSEGYDKPKLAFLRFNNGIYLLDEPEFQKIIVLPIFNDNSISREAQRIHPSLQALLMEMGKQLPSITITKCVRTPNPDYISQEA